MSLSMYQTSVPVFLNFLENLSAILGYAERHFSARNVTPDAILTSRLAPDMYTFAQQVGQATYHAAHCSAALASQSAPQLPDDLSSFDALQKRIAATVEFLNGLAPDSMEGSENATFSYIMRGEPHEFVGEKLLLGHCMPNFFFHVTTAYDLLRHNGLDLIKGHFMGYIKPGG